MVEMKGKNVLVVGMARSGVAAAQMLSRLGANLTLTDTRTREQMQTALEQLKDIQADWQLGTEPDDLIQGKDYIVLSPSVYYWAPWVEKAKQNGTVVISELQLGAWFTKGDFISITGTNGKTTTTTLVGEIFKNNGSRTHVLGNIGVPVCTEALDTQPGDVIVCETAPFMTVGNLDFRPKVSAILNLTEDHLNYFGTMENYINCKKKVYENQRGEDVCILNADDPRVVALRDEPKCRVLYFSRTQNIIQGACIKHGEIIVRIGRKDTPIMRADEVKIPGPHNLENALAAVLCAYVMGVKPEIIRHTLMTFAGVEHRIETVREVNGVTYINDSKATNPDSTIKAIQAMTKPTVLILGGSNKNSDYMPMFRAFTKYIQSIVVVGETSEQILSAAKTAGFISVHRAYTFEEAVQKARHLASPGMNVLLSPACASFDMFDNFEQRGAVFKRIVMELK